MTREDAARLLAAVDRGKIVLRVVNDEAEEMAAKAQGWTNDYAALPAPKVDTGGPRERVN